MLTARSSQAFWEKARAPSTSEEVQSSLQDQALVAHGKGEDIAGSFSKTLVKRAGIVCFCNGVEAVRTSWRG